MSNNLAKRILCTSLTIFAFMIGVFIIIGAITGIPYIFNNIDNTKAIVSSVDLFLIGVSFFFIMIELLKIVSNSNTTIFSHKNVKRFKIIGYILFVNSFIDYIFFILNGLKGMRIIDLAPGVFVTPSMAIYFISALLCFVIADAFNKAINMKNDNDLTI